MKKLWIFLLVLGLAIVMVGCGESDVETVEDEESSEESTSNGESNEDSGEESNSEGSGQDESNGSNEEESSEEEGGDQKESVSIGDTIKFDGLEITLNDAFTDSGGDFEQPENDHYLILDMTIENTTDESANVSTLMQMSLQDEEGYTHDVAMYTGTEGNLDGEIGAGRDNRGQVSFDVNQSGTYEFIFEHPFTNGQAIWEIDGSELE